MQLSEIHIQCCSFEVCARFVCACVLAGSPYMILYLWSCSILEFSKLWLIADNLSSFWLLKWTPFSFCKQAVDYTEEAFVQISRWCNPLSFQAGSHLAYLQTQAILLMTGSVRLQNLCVVCFASVGGRKNNWSMTKWVITVSHCKPRSFVPNRARSLAHNTKDQYQQKWLADTDL